MDSGSYYNVAIGDTFHGFCNGFADGNYDDYFVEAVGTDWAVARAYESGRPVFFDFCGRKPESMNEDIAEWKKDVWDQRC